MTSIVACCHGAKLCAHAARDFRSQHLKLKDGEKLANFFLHNHSKQWNESTKAFDYHLRETYKAYKIH